MKYFLLFILFLSLFSCVKKEDTENVIQEMINENTEFDKDIIITKIKDEDTLKNNELKIFDKNKNLFIEIGDKLNIIKNVYEIKLIMDRIYNNIILIEHICDNISFFISGYEPMVNNEDVFIIDFDRLILRIEICGKDIFTSRGISIGDKKELVIEKYGEPNYILNKLYGINNDNIKEVYSYYNSENDVRELNICFDHNGIVSYISLSAGD
jgi:hypothetical protein